MPEERPGLRRQSLRSNEKSPGSGELPGPFSSMAKGVLRAGDGGQWPVSTNTMLESPFRACSSTAAASFWKDP